MIERLLEGIEVRLNTDYLEQKESLDELADKVVYTGPIDAYFDYKLGTLEYRSVRFEMNSLTSRISREMQLSTIQIVRHLGHVSLSINGSNSARMRMAMICQRQ